MVGYGQRLEVKVRKKIYQQTPEYKEWIVEYRRLPEVKAQKRAYRFIKSKTDESFVICNRLRKRLNVALKQYGEGKKLHVDEYGIDYNAIIQHLGKKPEGEYVVDHIKALCSFDLTDLEQVKLAFAPENHRWLPKEENLKKISEDKKSRLNKLPM